MGEQAVFPFAKFLMEPACGFKVDYTITLVKKPYGSIFPVVFPVQSEGWQPDPPFVSIVDDEALVIAPTNGLH